MSEAALRSSTSLTPVKDVLFCDIECYKNFFYVAFKRLRDGVRVGFELSDRQQANWEPERIARLMRNNTIVTFNGMTYDVPMIYLALSGASNRELKIASDKIIKGGLKYWTVEKALGIRVPKIDHIDLIEPNPAVMQGLKILNGRLHGERLQDLPYPEDTELTDEQMDDVIDYCLHSDLDATENLFHALEEPLELRVALGAQFDRDFRSKSDAQFGEYIIKHRIEQKTGNKAKKSTVKPGDTFEYKVPDFIKFDDPRLVDLLVKIAETTFVIGADGKTLKPKHLKEIELKIGASEYSFGIGGLHSTESCRSAFSDDDYILLDADVASQYPRAISKLKLFPPSLGPVFNVVYDEIIDDRVKAKRAKDKVRDKGLKIALNGGGYGKLGSKHSVLYAPHLLLAVTLTCQLSVLMLVEQAEKRGISVISGNTDGVIFRCPRSLFNGFVMKTDAETGKEKATDRLMPSALQEITSWWEEVTGFELEFAEYKAIYNQSVNTYIAIKSDGTVKRKGPIGNPWSSRKEENDLRAQMSKNPQMTICSDAVLQFILDDTPIEETIRSSKDVTAFVTLINAAGGATWRDEYLGKVVRYIWSTDGDPIIKVKAHETTGNRPKVPKTDGCRPVMTLPKEFPSDIDYDRYIQEANKILTELGYYNRATFEEVVMSPGETFLRHVLKIN